MAADLIVTAKNRFRALLAKLKTSQLEMNEVRSSMGGLVADAVENHNLHKGAFAWTRRLDAMTPAKREEWLFQFEAYKVHMGWDKPTDMFRQREAEEMAAVQTTPIPRPRRGGRKPRLVEVPAEQAAG